MTRASRPCFTDLEVSFMLHVLKEAAAVKKQQVETLQAEKMRLEASVQSLSLRLFKEGPYNTCRPLKEDRVKLSALGGFTLNNLEKENIVLNGIISHLQKIQRHQRGHVKHLHSLFWSYLEELSALETQKAQISC
jgi:hypothetical protein